VLGAVGGVGCPRLVTDARTSEQRASRAFSAELLPPQQGVPPWTRHATVTSGFRYFSGGLLPSPRQQQAAPSRPPSTRAGADTRAFFLRGAKGLRTLKGPLDYIHDECRALQRAYDEDLDSSTDVDRFSPQG